MIFLAVSLLLAPGLLVNVVLKEVSARPRPNQVENFGGSAEFRPWFRFDGACRSNCSFVSGEGVGFSVAGSPGQSFAAAMAGAGRRRRHCLCRCNGRAAHGLWRPFPLRCDFCNPADALLVQFAAPPDPAVARPMIEIKTRHGMGCACQLAVYIAPTFQALCASR